ncbi:MAG: alpha/beta fold hydrolase [Mesorhizobium sp.]|nr:MAG: alpha/beta fold hydrolase [Mesorhizobium sp.]
MKRKQPAAVLASFLLAFVFATNAKCQEIELRFASTPDYEELLGPALKAFEDSVHAGSTFRIVKIELGDDGALSLSLADGTADVSIIPASNGRLPVGSYVAGAGVSGSRQRQESEVGALELASLERNGLVGLAFWNAPPRLISSNTKLDQVEDLAGLRIQALDLGQKAILEAYGAVPQDLGLGEVEAALKGGTIDAVAEQGGNKSYTSITQTVIPDAGSTVEFYFVARKEFWASLPSRARGLLAEAARSAGFVSDANALARKEENLRELTAQGANIIAIDGRRQSEVFAGALAAWTSREEKPGAEILSVAYARSFESPAVQQTRVGAAAAKRKVFFATNRTENPSEDIEYRFGTDRVTGGLMLGAVEVEFKNGRTLDDNLEDVATLESLVLSTSESDFENALAHDASAANSSVLVFVHGYSNRFGDAVRRAAHLAVETGFSGPIVVFSWPSEGETLLYNHDEDRIQATQPDFRRLMGLVEKSVGRQRVNLLAHSMGARVLLGYIDTLSALPEHERVFRSVTIAAGDTPNEVLSQQVGALERLSPHVTIYFSQEDRALWVSRQLHNKVRLGNNRADQLFKDIETKPLAASGFDFVDARFVDNDILTFSPRHSYIFDKRAAVDDYARLVVGGKPASARHGDFPSSLSAQREGAERFWQLNPD